MLPVSIAADFSSYGRRLVGRAVALAKSLTDNRYRWSVAESTRLDAEANQREREIIAIETARLAVDDEAGATMVSWFLADQTPMPARSDAKLRELRCARRRIVGISPQRKHPSVAPDCWKQATMNRIPTGWPTTSADGDGAPVVLAHEAPFTIGPLRVEPGMRRIVRGDGEEAMVEPLVMQVLVALARADGAILTRDELVDRCWGGRVVGDDSIARVIARLRKLGAEFGEDGFSVETITKVGYRLTAETLPTGPKKALNGATVAVPEPPRSKPRLAVIAALGASIAAAALVLAFAPFGDPATAATTRIGVEPVSNALSDAQAVRFAGDLTGDLARLGNAINGISVIDRTDETTAKDTDYVVRIAVEREAGGVAAIARMVATDDGSVFWSRRFVDGGGNMPRLRERVAVNTAAIIRCGLEKSAGQIKDPVSLKLFFGACDAFQNENPEVGRSFALKLVEREPDLAIGWGCLALAALSTGEADDPADAAARAKIERYARRALALDPQDPRAILTLIEIDRDDLPAVDLLEGGIGAGRESPELLNSYSVALYNAGYVTASVPVALRGLALDPTSRFAYELAVRRLLAAGRFGDALAMQRRAERLWPGHPETLSHRARLLTYWPDPREAMTILESIADKDVMAPFAADVVRWRVNRGAIDLAALERRAEALARTEPEALWLFVSALAAMDQTERGLVWLQRASKERAHAQWSILFAPHAAPLRRDPRFFRAMAELGLVEMWRKRGRWPDFCGEPGLRYDCKAEAARLAAGQPTASRS